LSRSVEARRGSTASSRSNTDCAASSTVGSEDAETGAEAGAGRLTEGRLRAGRRLVADAGFVAAAVFGVSMGVFATVAGGLATLLDFAGPLGPGFGLGAALGFGAILRFGAAVGFGAALGFGAILRFGAPLGFGAALGFGFDCAFGFGGLELARGDAALATFAIFFARLAAFLLDFASFLARLSAAFAARNSCFIAPA
jgi:hypothetical protein